MVVRCQVSGSVRSVLYGSEMAGEEWSVVLYGSELAGDTQIGVLFSMIVRWQVSGMRQECCSSMIVRWQVSGMCQECCSL